MPHGLAELDDFVNANLHRNPSSLGASFGPLGPRQALVLFRLAWAFFPSSDGIEWLARVFSFYSHQEEENTFQMSRWWWTLLLVLANVVLAHGAVASVPEQSRKFNIGIVFRKRYPRRWRRLVYKAAKRWEDILVRGYSTQVCLDHEDLANTRCSKMHRGLCVQDLTIFVIIKPLDGLNGLLARTGTCHVDSNLRPRLGRIILDQSDLHEQLSKGTLGYRYMLQTIVHEIAHVSHTTY